MPALIAVDVTRRWDPTQRYYEEEYLTCMNWLDVWTSSENALHDRNGDEFVMFLKKFWHPTVVKFCDNDISSG